MKVFVFITCIVCTLPDIIAQNESGGMRSATEITIENNGNTINGFRYEFKFPVYNIFYDPACHCLTVQTRKILSNKYYDDNGAIGVIDLLSHRTLWFEETDFFDKTENRDYLIRRSATQTLRVDKRTGKDLWFNTLIPYHFNFTNKTGLGYDKGSETLTAFSLDNGIELWKRKLSNEYGWDHTLRLGDTALLVSSSGLHYIDLVTGKGWDHITTTGSTNATRQALSAGGSILLGLTTGIIYIPNDDFKKNTLSGLSSNILVDHSTVFYAGAETVMSRELNGKINWERTSPPDSSSRSILLLKGRNLYHLNQGYAQVNGKETASGSPYFAIYDADNGKQKFHGSGISSPVKDLTIREKAIYLMTDKELYCVSTGNPMLKYFPIDQQLYGDGIRFLDTNAYFQDQQAMLKPVVSQDDQKLYIQTSSGKIIVMNPDFSFSHTISSPNIWILKGQTSQFDLLKGDNSLLLTNKDGEKVFYFSSSSKISLYKDFLLEVKNNTVTQIHYSSIPQVND